MKVGTVHAQRCDSLGPRIHTTFALCCFNRTDQSSAAGGSFKLELFLPEDYPMAAPKVLPVCLLTWHL